MLSANYQNRQHSNRFCCQLTYNLWQYRVEKMRPSFTACETGAIEVAAGRLEGNDKELQRPLESSKQKGWANLGHSC